MSNPSEAQTLESLVAYSAQLFEQHKRLRVFQMFSDGTLEDPTKREVFFACLQGIARHFQTILFARQAHCADERFGALFRRHLNEEIGHDEILRKDRGRADEIWDPVLEATMAWFVSRMTVLDNVEKLAIVHLVLEQSGANMGALTKDSMKRFGKAEYFGLHDEVDDSHVTMALEPLRRQPPETIARLRIVVEQAWTMLDTHADRVAALVLGKFPAKICAPEDR